MKRKLSAMQEDFLKSKRVKPNHKAPENLKVGDSIVFTKETENKDIVDLLLNQLLENQYKNTKYPEYYRLSICWKIALRKYIQDNNI